ncbi:MAG: DUF1569 domain-containing protein [Woeseiaceae bacterium]
MNRRGFLALSGAAAAGLVAGAVTVRRATLPAPSLEILIDDLNTMRGKNLAAAGTWSPFTVFSHLTQSVDYSLTGFPEMKSTAFRQTLGGAAFFAFSTAGAMRHDLAAPIPGAPALAEDGPTIEAIDRLVASLVRFEEYTGALQPHFAYGELGRDEYRAAHIFHVRNHFDEITIA